MRSSAREKSSINRANGSPGANWIQAVSGYSVPPISSNALSWPQFPSAAWVNPFLVNQEIWCTTVNIGNGIPEVCFLLRWNNLNTGAETGYFMTVGPPAGGGGYCETVKCSAGTDTGTTSLGYYASGGLATGEVHVWASAVKDTISLYGSTDGVTWNLRKTWTDNVYETMGYIAVYDGNNGIVAAIDDIGGGTIATPAVSGGLLPMSPAGGLRT